MPRFADMSDALRAIYRRNRSYRNRPHVSPDDVLVVDLDTPMEAVDLPISGIDNVVVAVDDSHPALEDNAPPSDAPATELDKSSPSDEDIPIIVQQDATPASCSSITSLQITAHRNFESWEDPAWILRGDEHYLAYCESDAYVEPDYASGWGGFHFWPPTQATPNEDAIDAHAHVVSTEDAMEAHAANVSTEDAIEAHHEAGDNHDDPAGGDAATEALDCKCGADGDGDANGSGVCGDDRGYSDSVESFVLMPAPHAESAYSWVSDSDCDHAGFQGFGAKRRRNK